jgi:NADH-quinone oxidoreductase subunit F
MPLTFEATREAGAFLGSGVVMVFDDSIDLARIVKRVAKFFRDESCGQCVPCRVGTMRQVEALDRVDIPLLNDIARAMRDASICGLGQTAANAVESALALRIIEPGEQNP